MALTEECYGGEPALNVCQEMLQLWNEAYADDLKEYVLFTPSTHINVIIFIREELFYPLVFYQPQI